MHYYWAQVASYHSSGSVCKSSWQQDKVFTPRNLSKHPAPPQGIRPLEVKPHTHKPHNYHAPTQSHIHAHTQPRTHKLTLLWIRTEDLAHRDHDVSSCFALSGGSAALCCPNARRCCLTVNDDGSWFGQRQGDALAYAVRDPEGIWCGRGV